MARDDLEYLTLADFTPGIYSKYGGSVQLGKDGAAQIHDGQGRYTYGCYPDPDGGLRPLPRRVARYGMQPIDTLRNALDAAVPWVTRPTARGVGTSDGGRRRKIGIIDAAVHSGERFEPNAYDSAPYRFDAAHARQAPDLLHILTSYREDPVPLATDPASMFPALGRLVNKWHMFTLTDLTTATGKIDVTGRANGSSNNPHRIIQQRAARVEEGAALSGIGAVPTQLSETGSGYTYSVGFLATWALLNTVKHDGWAAGSLAIGRSISTVIGDGGVTLDDIKGPGRITVAACLQTYYARMASDATEETYPNFFSVMGGSFYLWNTNDNLGYPRFTVGGGVAGPWTARQVPWYLVEHQDRFVGVIEDLEATGGVDPTGVLFLNWHTPSNRIRYTELNGVGRMWIATSSPNNAANGRFTNYTELWKFTETAGVFSPDFGTGTTVTGAPSAPEADVMGNNLVERIGAMFSWQNDLVIIPYVGEGSIVRGSMEDPTVIRSGTIVPTGGVVCHAAQTPEGVIYGSTAGVYLWDGGSSKHISPQLDGWFWDGGEINETHADGYRRKAHASMGRFTYSHPFVYAPNNWVMDLRTGAWSRLMDPADTSNPYPYMHYVTNENGDVYAVRGCYDGSDFSATIPDKNYFADRYSSTQRAWRWQWIGQPIQSSVTRELKVEEVVIVGQGLGTIEVEISGGDANAQPFTFTFDDQDRPQRFVQSYQLHATDVVVKVFAQGQGSGEFTAGVTDAPTLHSIHLGSRPAKQVSRD